MDLEQSDNALLAGSIRFRHAQVRDLTLISDLRTITLNIRFSSRYSLSSAVRLFPPIGLVQNHTSTKSHFLVAIPILIPDSR